MDPVDPEDFSRASRSPGERSFLQRSGTTFKWLTKSCSTWFCALHRSTTRTLRMEALENRQLLSGAPALLGPPLLPFSAPVAAVTSPPALYGVLGAVEGQIGTLSQTATVDHPSRVATNVSVRTELNLTQNFGLGATLNYWRSQKRLPRSPPLHTMASALGLRKHPPHTALRGGGYANPGILDSRGLGPCVFHRLGRGRPQEIAAGHALGRLYARFDFRGRAGAQGDRPEERLRGHLLALHERPR